MRKSKDWLQYSCLSYKMCFTVNRLWLSRRIKLSISFLQSVIFFLSFFVAFPAQLSDPGGAVFIECWCYYRDDVNFHPLFLLAKSQILFCFYIIIFIDALYLFILSNILLFKSAFIRVNHVSNNSYRLLVIVSIL